MTDSSKIVFISPTYISQYLQTHASNSFLISVSSSSVWKQTMLVECWRFHVKRARIVDVSVLRIKQRASGFVRLKSYPCYDEVTSGRLDRLYVLLDLNLESWVSMIHTEQYLGPIQPPRVRLIRALAKLQRLKAQIYPRNRHIISINHINVRRVKYISQPPSLKSLTYLLIFWRVVPMSFPAIWELPVAVFSLPSA